MREPYCPHDDMNRDPPGGDFEVWMKDESGWLKIAQRELKEDGENVFEREVSVALNNPRDFPKGAVFEFREFGRVTETVTV